jgi:hypothetical protein
MVVKHIQYDDGTHQLVCCDAITDERAESEYEHGALPIILGFKGKIFIAISDFYDDEDEGIRAQGVYLMKLQSPRPPHEGETVYLVE